MEAKKSDGILPGFGRNVVSTVKYNGGIIIGLLIICLLPVSYTHLPAGSRFWRGWRTPFIYPPGLSTADAPCREAGM